MAASISKQISIISFKNQSPNLIRGPLQHHCALYMKTSAITPSHISRSVSTCQSRLTHYACTHHRPVWLTLGYACIRPMLPRAHPLEDVMKVRYVSTDVTSDKRDCWKCGKTINIIDALYFCSACGVVQPALKKQSYFQVLGVAETFDIESKELTEKYRNLQRQLHPDKYSQKSDTEKEYSIEHSTLVNKAYSTLVKPLSRGLYLLRIREEDLEKELDLNPEFLGRVMELNEALLEADTRDDIERLGTENQRTVDELVERVSLTFKDGDLRRAKELLLQLKYFDNINEKFKERITWFNEKST